MGCKVVARRPSLLLTRRSVFYPGACEPSLSSLHKIGAMVKKTERLQVRTGNALLRDYWDVAKLETLYEIE